MVKRLGHQGIGGGGIKIEIVITTGNGGHRIMMVRRNHNGRSWAEDGNPVMASLVSIYFTLEVGASR